MNIDNILNNLFLVIIFKLFFPELIILDIVSKNISKFCPVEISGYIKNISAIG